MLNGLDSGMRVLDGLPSPHIPFPAPAPAPGPGPASVLSSSRNRIVRMDPGQAPLPAKAPVALIASSKSRLIDEFRRRVARK